MKIRHLFQWARLRCEFRNLRPKDGRERVMQGFAKAARKAALVSVALSSIVFVLCLLAIGHTGETLVRLQTSVLMGLLGLIGLPPITALAWHLDRRHRRHGIRHEGEVRAPGSHRHR
ncbi:MAG: hypothetical protein KDA28_09460, partial [Phycisphaerales bacterium]|nr:hypothetical protein [Phycisphaerales bacterium]